MPIFHRRHGQLYCENVRLESVAHSVGTPTYCYSHAGIVANYRAFAQAVADMPATVCFAVKANPNLAVLRCLARLGAGGDVVSIGEMRCALAAGIAARHIVFSGVGKTRAEMDAALEAGVGQFNIESEDELETLAVLAQKQGRTAPVAMRFNPDIDAGTHEKISTGRREDKFGLCPDTVCRLYARAVQNPHLDVRGLAIHIGSQIVDLTAFERAFARLRTLVDTLRHQDMPVPVLDVGGGLGVPYKEGESPPDISRYAEIVRREIVPLGCHLIFEPGRCLVADTGVLLSRVVRLKQGTNRIFVVLDAGMNDLARPALYDSYHAIVPVYDEKNPGTTGVVDVVGPICESADTLARQRALPPLAGGDLVAISHAGAYGAAMASTYNVRPKIAEVLVHEDHYHVVQPRGVIEDMIAVQTIPVWLDQ